MSVFPPSSQAELCIDLVALVANWRRLRDLAAPADCAAVVKANAYGLGDVPVARALADAGCRSFYVATVEEAERLVPALPAAALVFVFNGVGASDMSACRQRGFVPVLSTPAQASEWRQANRSDGRVLPCSLHVDTGMNRLGLEYREWQHMRHEFSAAELGAKWIMSHLACAEEVAHPLNLGQLNRFNAVVGESTEWAPQVRASFANSSGVLLGPDYRFDQVRPGIALYGGNPELNRPNRFRPVAHLRLPILQLRRVGEDGSVGYGALASVRAGALLATVQGGYADGLLISQSGLGEGEIAGCRVPMIGRISMDLSIFDVSGVPDVVWNDGRASHFIEVLNTNLTVDDMARAAGTISYEVLTRLGPRFRRAYIGADSQRL